MRFTLRASCVGILFLIAVNAKGQFLQFADPGGPEAQPVSLQERIEREIADAPWHLGPVRIAPVVTIRDAAYVRDLFGGTGRSDFTVTAGAGFNAYAHTGRKVVWIGHVLPEYAWWQEEEDARRLNLSYGVETIGLFNRLTVDVAARRTELQRILTPEVTVPVSTGNDLGRIDAELEATGSLFPFLSARWSRQEGLVDERDDPRIESLELLDREETLARAGVRWRPRTGWMIGVGAERTQVDFERPELDSSNEGTAPVLELIIDRRILFFTANLAARSLTAREGSRFTDFDGVTGHVGLNLLPAAKLQAWVYGNRNLVYSLSPTYPYLDDERIGLSLGMAFGKRLFIRGYAETGTNDYVASSPGALHRSDDLLAVGGAVRFSITEALLFSLTATRIDYDSNLPGNDRTFTSGGITFALRGNLVGTTD